MHREYAVDPESLSDYSNLRTMFESFVGSQSRLISDCPRNWHREVLGAINQLREEGVGPNKRKGLKNQLQKLCRTNMCKNRTVEPWAREASWLCYAEVEHERYPFDAILSSGTPTDPDHPVYGLDELFFNCPSCWQEPNQAHVRRLAPEIVGQAMSMLRVSKRIVLVDPYFWFTQPRWDNYRPLLVELFRVIGDLNFNRGVGRLEIHTSDRHSNAGGFLHTHVVPLMPRGISVQCKIWPKAQMHDRFILTDVGGVFLGQGLSEFELSGDEEVLIGVLERETFRKEAGKLDGEPVEKSIVES
ncbi:MAG: hypothetical protein AAGI72_15640 [Pseudomonadota bacterium]